MLLKMTQSPVLSSGSKQCSTTWSSSSHDGPQRLLGKTASSDLKDSWGKETQSRHFRAQTALAIYDRVSFHSLTSSYSLPFKTYPAAARLATPSNFPKHCSPCVPKAPILCFPTACWRKTHTPRHSCSTGTPARLLETVHLGNGTRHARMRRERLDKQKNADPADMRRD